MTMPQNRLPIALRGFIIFGFIFGIITLYSGGSVLFGPDEARNFAGAYMPFVVWFNFLAGGFYILAAIGLWLRKRWSTSLAIAISISTVLVAAVFAYTIIQGAAFEMRTVGAMVIPVRSGRVWRSQA
jgi:glucan phosphoethanolaminetransferase (alkaline phosphatase superfamily)